MTLEDLGNLGDFMAAVGVIVSLIYLALQIKQNTHQMRQNSKSLLMTNELAGSELGIQGFMALAQNTELADIYRRGTRDLDVLSRDEKFRFGNLMLAIFYINQAGFHNQRQGLSDDDAWRGHTALYREILGFPGVRTWWQAQGHVFSPLYRQFVDGLIAKVQEG